MKINVQFAESNTPFAADMSAKPTTVDADMGITTVLHNGKSGIPAGGKAGQLLYKKSDKDFDVEWRDLQIPEQYGLVTYDQDKTLTIT